MRVEPPGFDIATTLRYNHNGSSQPPPGGVTVRVVDWVALLYVAEIVTAVSADTLLLVTPKVALVAPAGTMTVLGTAAAGSLLDNAITRPPAGAGAASDTVPTELFPIKTRPGLTDTDESSGLTVIVAV